MKLVSWQTNLPGCEIEVKCVQIQQVWIVLPTVASVSWKAGQAEHKYKPPSGQIQRGTMSFAKNSILHFPPSQVCVERIFGSAVFQILPLDRLWMKYTYMEFKCPQIYICVCRITWLFRFLSDWKPSTKENCFWNPQLARHTQALF